MGKFVPEKKRLKGLLEDIDCGKIKLPSFQRKYKWTAPQVKKLLDSIQNDHPAGSLLFLAVDYTNPLIPEIGWNYLKHRLRSHKEVAKRFYSDIYDPSNPANPIKISALQ
ncbi:DUF262 domain-containing protein [Helicobacter rodentium]|uniref:DUF262 domain-containing protein n=1 Tax=Helicobacter rodentium TaxID=59617 RepID=UPI002602BEE4|nr:DUF262 domain-containing protein [Helicobacter rodentium]